jgi:two-component system, response regulator, stage 0 sporulation protein F
MPRLLVVEDDSSLRRLYSAEFEEEGYVVATAASGEEALSLVREAPPDVIVLDICLGAENGLDVLRKVLDERPEVRVILNSAYSSFKADFTTWSAESYLVKSADLTELKGAVARACGKGKRAA